MHGGVCWMRARGRGMTWWARTAQKSGSRLLPNAAVPVWLSSALRTSAMAPEKKLETGAPWVAAAAAVAATAAATVVAAAMASAAVRRWWQR